jgi:DNA polymerase-1
MRTQPVDNAACRELFSELEFTTLLKELAPAADNTAHRLQPEAHPSRNRRPARRSQAREPGSSRRPRHRHLRRRPRHLRRDRRRARSEARSRTRTSARRNHGPLRPPQPAQVSPAPVALFPRPPDPACRLGLAVSGTPPSRSRSTPPASALRSKTPPSPSTSTTSKPSSAPSRPTTSPSRGVETDVMLQSYLVNPTHARTRCPTSPRAPPTARSPSAQQGESPDPKRLAEAAAAIVRLANVFAGQIAEATRHAHIPKDDNPSAAPSPRDALRIPPQTSPLQHIYRDHGPAARPRPPAHGAGRRPHRSRAQSSRHVHAPRRRDGHLAERIYADSGQRFNINSPKQLGDVLFNKMDCCPSR